MIVCAAMMPHGVSEAFADRFLVAGAVAAGFVATWIMLGMCGMRIQSSERSRSGTRLKRI